MTAAEGCDHEGKVDENGYCTFCNALVEAFETGGKHYTSLEQHWMPLRTGGISLCGAI